MSNKSQSTPWNDGYWYCQRQKMAVIHLERNKAEWRNLVTFDCPDLQPLALGSCTYGDFGPAPKDIVDATGTEHYNVLIDLVMMKQKGVLNKDGTQIHAYGFSNSLEIMNWTSEEEMKKILDEREPSEAPLCSYFKPQPDKPGKFLWISGIDGLIVMISET